MSMQMAAHAPVPNVIFAWKPTSIHDWLAFTVPLSQTSILIVSLTNTEVHTHKETFVFSEKLHSQLSHLHISFVSVWGRVLNQLSHACKVKKKLFQVSIFPLSSISHSYLSSFLFPSSPPSSYACTFYSLILSLTASSFAESLQCWNHTIRK